VDKKGFQHSIRAIARLASAGHTTSYVIVGEGPYRRELEGLAENLGVGHLLKFHGWRPHADVLAEMERSHIFLQPSVRGANGNSEGIPNALKEAMAMGMPVVASDHSGIPELVEHGISGCLVPEGNVDELERSIVQLLSRASWWEEMVTSARNRVLAKFDIHEVSRRLVEIYHSVTAEGSSLGVQPRLAG